MSTKQSILAISYTIAASIFVWWVSQNLTFKKGENPKRTVVIIILTATVTIAGVFLATRRKK